MHGRGDPVTQTQRGRADEDVPTFEEIWRDRIRKNRNGRYDGVALQTHLEGNLHVPFSGHRGGQRSSPCRHFFFGLCAARQHGRRKHRIDRVFKAYQRRNTPHLTIKIRLRRDVAGAGAAA